MKIQASLLLASLSLLLTAATPALAQIWSGNGTDNNWTTADNWGGTAPVATDPLTFSGTTRQSNTNDFTTNTIFDSITLTGGGFNLSGNAVQLSNAGTKVTSTGNNTIALGLTPTTGAMTIASQSDTLTISGNIGGTGGLTKSGTGTLFLTGNNAYTGTTTLSGGTLRLGSANAIRTDNTTLLSFTANSTLDLNGFNATINNSTLPAGSQILLGGGNLTIGLTDANYTYGGVISGNGTVKKAGANMLTLNAQQTYNGVTQLVNGNIRNGINNALPTNTVLEFTDSGAARRLVLQGFNQTLAGVSSTTGGGTLIIEAASDNISNAPATLTLNVAANESYNFGGLVRNAAGNATNSALTVVKNGEGTQIFSGNGVNNTGPSYSGTTTINAGILEFAGSGALNPATANNSQIILNGGSVRFSGGAASNEVPLRTAAITGTGDVRIANIIRIGGGNHTFNGSVILENGGRLRTTAANTLPSTTVLRFAADDTARRLQMQGHSQTIAGVDSTLATGGILIIEAAEDNASNLPATLTLNVADAQSYNFSGYLRDASGNATNSALSITKSGNGTQVFSGQGAIVNYTGNTTVNGGVLEFSGTNSVVNNSAMTVNADGTVRFSGGGNRTTAITGAGSLEKTGNNVLTLSGTNTHTGNTTVTAGTLLINGSTAAGSAVSVASGATLGGSGTIGGNLSLANGARFGFNTANTAFTLTLTGTLTFDNSFGVASLRNLDGTDIAWDTIALNTTYTLLNTSFTFNDTNIQNFGFDNRATGLAGGREAYFQNGSLQLVVIPEPSTWALLAGSLTALMIFRRRRQGSC